MSAEVLRQAAALMRERAQATVAVLAAAGEEVPWHSEASLALEWDVEDAAHIASWSPAVALAVADWLEGTTERHGPLTECSNLGCRRRGLSGLHCGDDCEKPHEDCADWRAALAVARAYIGGAS